MAVLLLYTIDLTTKKTVPVVTGQHFSKHDRNKININYVISD